MPSSSHGSGVGTSIDEHSFRCSINSKRLGSSAAETHLNPPGKADKSRNSRTLISQKMAVDSSSAFCPRQSVNHDATVALKEDLSRMRRVWGAHAQNLLQSAASSPAWTAGAVRGSGIPRPVRPQGHSAQQKACASRPGCLRPRGRDSESPPTRRRSSASQRTNSNSSQLGFHSQAAMNGRGSGRRRLCSSSSSGQCETGSSHFVTSFYKLFREVQTPVPVALIRGLDRKEATALGRVKVMLRIAPNFDSNAEESEPDTRPFLELDGRMKQLTFYEPLTTMGVLEDEKRLRGAPGVSAPKMFAFDAIFGPDELRDDICSKVLMDVLPAVVNGTDACVFSYGYSRLGKSWSMIGESERTEDVGAIPCAISWLFRLIQEQKQRTGARFSVRVSAAEIFGKNETVRDLLASHASGTEGGGPFFPGMFLSDREGSQALGLGLCELRAPSVEKAAYYLDCALAASSSATMADMDSDGTRSISHFIFTLNVYQYRVEPVSGGLSGNSSGVAGGRSRLYLVDLGGCERQSQVYSASKTYRLSMANLGNVILAIFNGQKHVPYKDSKLTRLLREILGNVTCRATMLAHISSSRLHYTDSLATVQLASRIHRLRHKKWKHLHPGGSPDDSFGHFRRREDGSHGPHSSSSDFDCTTSSSEQSCDTVIFVGSPAREKTLHEGVEEEGLSCTPPTTDSLDSFAVPHLAAPKSSFAQIRRVDGTCRNLPPFLSQLPVPKAKTHGVTSPSPSGGGGSGGNGLPKQYSAGGDALVAESRRNRGSDPMWVDGPKVTRSSKVNSGNVSGVAYVGCNGNGSSPLNITGSGMSGDRGDRETWVDGPRAPPPPPPPPVRHCDPSFLDEHKRCMIERWIEMQISGSPEVAGIPRRTVGVEDGPTLEGHQLQVDLSNVAKQCCSSTGETEVVSIISDSFVSTDDTEHVVGAGTTSVSCDTLDEPLPLDGISPKAYQDVDFYKQVMLHLSKERSVGCSSAIDEEDEEDVTLESDRGSLGTESGKRTGVMMTTDSWVQVTEDEILSATVIDHPLRILSMESLAMSFTNSSRFSWDSGLNAMRKALVDVAVDTCSVHSDPGDFPEDQCSNGLGFPCRRGSRSLESLLEAVAAFDSHNNEPFVGDQPQGVCCAFQKLYGGCGCCDFKLLRRPDGASDPHLDRHPSAPDLSKAEWAACSKDDDGGSVPKATRSDMRVYYDIPRIQGGTGIGSEDQKEGDCILQAFMENKEMSTELSTAASTYQKKPLEQRIQMIRSGGNHGTGNSNRSCKSSAASESANKTSSPEIGSGNSSGYESGFPKDSGSGSSNQDSLSFSSDEALKPGSSKDPKVSSTCPAASDVQLHQEILQEQDHGNLLKAGSIELITYEEEYVERIERRMALEKGLHLRLQREKMMHLKQKREELNKELAAVKCLLMIDDDKWNSDCFVDEGMDFEDPSVIEALEQETQILEKRLNSCRAHLMLVTSFDARKSALSKYWLKRTEEEKGREHWSSVFTEDI